MAPPSATRPDLVVCDGCAASHRRPRLAAGQVARCRRCDAVIVRGHALGHEAQFALGVAALVVFVIANLTTIVELDLRGLRTQATLLQAVHATWNEGQELIALLAFTTAFAFPLLVIALRLYVLAPIVAGVRPPALALARRLLRLGARWSMVEVFMLGTLIAYVRGASLADATPGEGLFAFAALALLFTAQQAAEIERIGRHAHPPMSLQRSTAYLIAAAVLYVPSNLLPVMSTRSVLTGGDRQHTLMGGIGELWSAGSWELALIVFVASIVVPMMKMVSLTLLLVTARRRSRWRRRERSRLFRMVDAVGHWSMLDVYVVVMLAGMVQFDALGEVQAELGLLAFGAVVVFTMLSAENFDPRLIWPEDRDGRA